MILVNTGNGKGKTTAALGQAMRAVGEGKRVLMIQFIKGPWRSGEDIFATSDKRHEAGDETDPRVRLLKNFEIRKMGKGFVGILGDTLPRAEHAAAAKEALETARREIAEGDWDLLILDEINNAIDLELIDLGEVLVFLDSFPKEKHLILTGRDVHPEVLKRADIATEMGELKHVYHEGIKAKRGIEY